MDIPQESLNNVEKYADESRRGIFPVDAAALYAIQLIIKYDNPDYIHTMPDNVKNAILEMIETWKNKGAFIIYFDKGSADHSHLLAELTKKLDSKKQAPE
ncbi:hypothetical protein [Lysobacter capsici]|uniref:hypothetical protein n=1 Tax=Lysobacter capsici TaxID=435897 RepID=UPI0012906476|nr:hypothetical protein [Lysobacter capsici]WND82017.1 hypothetical protein RJ610_06555 [Lysobacter capsici]WND87213.1 hypothetical protein RJ609_06560 [Lysobacter capsici]